MQKHDFPDGQLTCSEPSPTWAQNFVWLIVGPRCDINLQQQETPVGVMFPSIVGPGFSLMIINGFMYLFLLLLLVRRESVGVCFLFVAFYSNSLFVRCC